MESIYEDAFTVVCVSLFDDSLFVNCSSGLHFFTSRYLMIDYDGDIDG